MSEVPFSACQGLKRDERRGNPIANYRCLTVEFSPVVRRLSTSHPPGFIRHTHDGSQ
jgi:hypothetical protein